MTSSLHSLGGERLGPPQSLGDVIAVSCSLGNHL